MRFSVVSIAVAISVPLLANAADLTKRDNPVYFNLECSGDNMGATVRKCNNKALNGDWCNKNCKCTWTGCTECNKFDGCSKEVVSGTCAAEGINGWDCKCVGFGEKAGKVEKCAS